MNDKQTTYTYRAGKKLELRKSPDKIVVRALPERLKDPAIVAAEQVSSHSTRITTAAAELEPLMNRNRAVAPTHHAYYDARTGAEFLITDRIMVVFETAPTAEQLDQFAGRYSLVQKAAYSEREFLFQLTNHTGMNPVKLVVKLTEEEPLVAAAENDLNQRFQKGQPALPLDPEYQRQWHLHTAFNDPQFDPRASARCQEAWGLLDHFGRSEVVAAVTDDGCKLDHIDFDSPGKFADWGYFRGTRLFTSRDIDAEPSEMYKPGANHGTSCAGVIAGETDAQLTVGAAPGCRLLPIQWESEGPSLFISDSKLLTALTFIADKADICSNSWGGVPTFVLALPVINRIKALAQNGGRRGKGLLFLWAAGNENCPISHTAAVDVPYTHGWQVHPDGSAEWVGPDTARLFERNFVGIPGVMNIAALASTARRSHYSNYGTGIDLCAPTSNSHSYFRMQVPGLGITTTTGETGGVTRDFGGTSSATPLVAGIAALIISANPALTAAQIVSILKQTASKDLNMQGYGRTPPSAFNPDTSWDVSPIAPFDTGAFSNTGNGDGTWSPWFGHGRVDARAAVAEALRRIQPGRGDLEFTGESQPAKSIPDNSAAGIKDKIVCADEFAVDSVQVQVDITHTYIGDLRVTLSSPSGAGAVLHDRSGSSAHDIHRQYDSTTAPQLHLLKNQPAAGAWTLHVQDLAAQDRGRLQGWRLLLTGQDRQAITVSESPGVIIPDDNPTGISRTLAVAEGSSLEEIHVELDITHTFLGDLLVELISPGNRRVVLHNRVGGGADNLVKSFNPANTPALDGLRGEQIQGTWKLQVSDRAGADQGKLNRWALKLITAA